jgi:uncharacterized protein YerC
MRKISNYGNVALQQEEFDVLVGILGEAQGKSEVEAVLRTILTDSERTAISQRLGILRMINKGFKYFDIETKLGASSNTITKATDIYAKHGQFNSKFNEVLKRFKFEENAVSEITAESSASAPLVTGIRGLQRQNQKDAEKADKYRNEQAYKSGH